jgi:hypothetical protein
MPEINPSMQGQEDREFEASLGYITRPYLKEKKKKKRQTKNVSVAKLGSLRQSPKKYTGIESGIITILFFLRCSQAALKLTVLLSQPLKSWNYRCGLPSQAGQ